MVAESQVTTKGQVTLPSAVRDALGIRAGDRIAWTTRPDGVIEVRKVRARSLDDFVGMLGVPPRQRSVEDLDEAILRRARGA